MAIEEAARRILQGREGHELTEAPILCALWTRAHKTTQGVGGGVSRESGRAMMGMPTRAASDAASMASPGVKGRSGAQWGAVGRSEDTACAHCKTRGNSP